MRTAVPRGVRTKDDRRRRARETSHVSRSHTTSPNKLHFTFLSTVRTGGSARSLQVCGYVLRVPHLTQGGRRRLFWRRWPQGILGVKFGRPRLAAPLIGDEIAIAGSPPAVAVKAVHRNHHGGCRSSGRRHRCDERRRNSFRGVGHLHREQQTRRTSPKASCSFWRPLKNRI